MLTVWPDYHEYALKELIFPVFLDRTTGDINGDGIVNVLDIVYKGNKYLDNNEYNPIADFNGDGQLDIIDIVQFISIIVD